MDVELYVYDLSRGLARQMSRQFLGIQIDAVYHTSLVFGGVEYFFGLGVQTCRPGTTHHGRPMEVVPMGQTSLPIELILEYLESLKEVYTAESYDLFAHNCNNFTQDFATFLVGHGIPEHITSLPRTVLQTPFGQMLRPQLDSAMRGMTQAPLPSRAAVTNGNHYASPNQINRHVTSNSLAHTNGPNSNGSITSGPKGEVYNVSRLDQLNKLLESAKSSSAVILFTSATCTPCRLVYPTYDELAAESSGKCYLIKVDISNAYEIASKYQIRATPTFISFLKGKQESSWTGADPTQLKGNVRMLILSAFPSHPHEKLSLQTFKRQSSKPIIYNKVPPLDKLSAKLGSTSSDPGIQSAITFIKSRNAQQIPQELSIPDLPKISNSLTKALVTLDKDLSFIAVDLLRLLLLDPRISSYFLASPTNLTTLTEIFSHTVELLNKNSCPYNLHLTTLHAACNISTSASHILTDSCALSDPEFAASLMMLVSTGLLSNEHSTLRVASASLAYNLSTAGMNLRIRAREASNSTSSAGTNDMTKKDLPEASKVELAASLIEALSSEAESKEAVKLEVLALARLVYLLPHSSSEGETGEEGEEVLDLCRAMDVRNAVSSKASFLDKSEERLLLKELGEVLLGKGLK